MGESRLVQAVKEHLKEGLRKGLRGPGKVSGLGGVMNTVGSEFQQVEQPWRERVVEPWTCML